MNIWSIIIAAAIFILPSLLPGKNKAGKKTVSAAPATNVDVQEEDATFMDDEGGAFFEEDEVTVEEDDLGQPYFSYETVGESDAEPSVKITEKDVASKLDETYSMSITTLDEDFDLRKAIIYQTIMQRVCA